MKGQQDHHTGFNPHFDIRRKQDKSEDYYISGLLNHNRYILSETITLMESRNTQKRKLALSVLEKVKNAGATSAVRMGITGTPGVGKSTLIETFGMYLIEQGYKPAVLTIDPSSPYSQGSILGDKTRMPRLSVHPDAYVRPSSSGSLLGGTATYTKDIIRLCETAGFDFIIVETVGIGQSETDIKDMTDVTIILLQPGAGDEIQGIKRGILEAGDIFVVTKSDGVQKNLATQTQHYYTQALKFFHHDIPAWTCPVLTVSALENQGMDVILQTVQSYMALLIEKGFMSERRRQQDVIWFKRQLNGILQGLFWENENYRNTYIKLSEQVKEGKISTTRALDHMRQTILNYLR